MNTNHSSYYLQTKQQIDEEHEAAIRGLLGPAVVARHAFIESRLTQRANRILELIEQHRLSDALLLLEHEAWGEDDVPTPVNQAEADDEDEDVGRLDDPARLVRMIQHRFVLLAQVLVRHPLLRHRQIRETVPMHDGPDADGYVLDALLFRFVPADDALAAHLEEAVQPLPLGWRSYAQVRVALWRGQPIGVSLACSWDATGEMQHRLAAMQEHAKRYPVGQPFNVVQEAQRMEWSEAMPLAVFERAERVVR